MQIEDAKARANEIIAKTQAKADISGADETAGYLERMGIDSLVSDSKPVSIKTTVPDAHPGGCISIVHDCTGSIMASCGLDKTVKMWDTVSMRVSSTLRVCFS